MTDSIEQKSALRRMPFGLLGMVIVVITAEASARSNLDQISDWLSFNWRYAAESVAGPAAKADVVLLGDSLIKGGVLPSVIEPRLGTSVYNLSIQGGTAPTSYFLLKRLVESGSRPRLVVVDFHPNLLAVAPRSTETWGDLLTLRESADLLWNSGDLPLFARTSLLRAFPSYRHRSQTRAAILAALRGQVVHAKRYNDLLRQAYERSGAALLLPIQDQVRGPESASNAGQHRSAWKPHRCNATYVRRLLQLAEDNGITVAWLLPPTSPEWLARRRAMNAEAPHEAYVRAMSEKFPSIVVIDGRDAEYPSTAFKDLTHLHVGGASELSLGLAAILPRFLRVDGSRESESPRWLKLPRYQGQPLDPGLEVFDELELALKPAREFVRR